MATTAGSNPAPLKPRNIRNRLLATLLLAVACGATCAAFLVYSLGGSPDRHPAAPPTPQQQLGLSLYSAHCAACHEQNQLHLNPPPPNLHGLFLHPHLPSGAPATDAAVTRIILQGKAAMPPFASRLSAPEVAAIVAYLHTGPR